MEDSDIVNHATQVLTHISEAVSSLQAAVELMEAAEAPTPPEIYLLARLDICIDLLNNELPQTDSDVMSFQVEGVDF